jgi:hypothetical protein
MTNRLTTLQELFLCYDSILAQVPSEIGLLTSSDDLRRSENNFTGFIPRTVVNTDSPDLRVQSTEAQGIITATTFHTRVIDGTMALSPR